MHITSRIDEKSIGKKKKNWRGYALVTIAPTIVQTIQKQNIMNQKNHEKQYEIYWNESGVRLRLLAHAANDQLFQEQ